MLRRAVRHLVRPLLGPRVSVAARRRGIELAGRIALLAPGTTRERVRLGTSYAERVVPLGADPSRAVLYLHGGGFQACSPATHRGLTTHLAAGAGCAVLVLDYRLVPEHPYPAALDDAKAAWQHLLDQGFAGGDLAIAGDSAGAGLALALAVDLRDGGRETPAALGLMSPWVDLSLTGLPDDAQDTLLRRSWLEQCAGQYAGGLALDDARVSPLLADLTGLPPTLVQAGSEEILRGDAERLLTALHAAGVPAELSLGDGLWHVWQLHAGLMTESSRAVEELGTFLWTAGRLS